MTLFRFRWLRRWVRKNTNPIAENKAGVWKQHLSIAYMLISWNALGIVLYLYASGRPDPVKEFGLRSEEELKKMPAIYFAEVLGVKKAHIIDVKGFQKVGDCDCESQTSEKIDS